MAKIGKNGVSDGGAILGHPRDVQMVFRGAFGNEKLESEISFDIFMVNVISHKLIYVKPLQLYLC